MFQSEAVDVQLIDGTTVSVELWHIRRVDSNHKDLGNLAFLQNLRSEVGKSTGANLPTSASGRYYLSMAPMFLAALQSAPLHVSDAILQLPSRYPEYVQPYGDTVRSKCGPSAVDLTLRFRRTSIVSSGSGASLRDLYEALNYDPDDKEGEISSIILIDDIFCSGKTVGAALSRLRDSGLPRTCNIQVVAPLWIDNTL